MTEKRTAGRPTKGEAVRSAMVSVRVEPWVVASLDNDRNDGESRADVLTRWAEHYNYLRGADNEPNNS